MKCYIVIELKVVEFIPEFAGKINFYVNAADIFRPSMGLFSYICYLLARYSPSNEDSKAIQQHNHACCG